jgi:ABC-type proline/glycine betaine transport system ATPase subunit
LPFSRDSTGLTWPIAQSGAQSVSKAFGMARAAVLIAIVEAMTLATRIAVMREGRIEHYAVPDNFVLIARDAV